MAGPRKREPPGRIRFSVTCLFGKPVFTCTHLLFLRQEKKKKRSPPAKDFRMSACKRRIAAARPSSKKLFLFFVLAVHRIIHKPVVLSAAESVADRRCKAPTVSPSSPDRVAPKASHDPSGTRLVGDGGPSAKALGDWVRFKYPPTAQGPRRPAHWSIAAPASRATNRTGDTASHPPPAAGAHARRNRVVRPARGQSGRRLTQVSPSVSHPPAG